MSNENTDKQELIYGFTKPVHDLSLIYIERNILKNDTSLINALLSNDFEQFNYDFIENIYNLSPQWISELTTENKAILEKYNLTNMDDIEDFLEQEIDDEKDMLPEADAKLLDDLAYDWKTKDSEVIEVFEWWAVTEWFASKLEDIGEPILKNDYGFWWGRTCTGQAIILDGTIQQIALK